MIINCRAFSLHVLLRSVVSVSNLRLQFDHFRHAGLARALASAVRGQ
eukprot:CAMPEP_0179287008 /NCGR_PEP_ID=MMETSP0797-20121207/40045_1 /TAXON_ID=47934 /ORGANISM="Dinophysis acuminata, Strain DAEP01" /LENGTH=46 /DNA_ID= /DNA_START= /DNA_END= /DNA_ORIENTATION=